EEISRNRSRRSKRKAARLAKVKEHFAKREEENKQGTKTKESKVTETSMQEHASLLEETPCSPLSQQTARPPTCNQISPSPESLKSAEHSGDSTDIFSQARTQDEDDNIIHSKTNLSTANTNLPLEDSIGCDESTARSPSEVLEDIQHTERITDQTVSINQAAPVSQNPDLSIVEKAWKDFEKDAKQRIKMHEGTNISDGKPKEDVCLKTNSEPQMSSHGFTFGTVVAPLYHQVFKSMEIERKDFFPKPLGRSFRKLEDESRRAVTAPETTDIWPESCISTKQTVDDISVAVCKESTEDNSQLTVNPTKKTLPRPNQSKHVENEVASYNQNDYAGGIREYPRDSKFTETNLSKVTSEQSDPPLGEVSTVCAQALTEYAIQDDPCQNPCLFPQQGPEILVTTNQTSLPEQIRPSSPTAVLKTSSGLDHQSLCIKTEMSQNQEDPTIIHTKEENISVQMAQSPEDPTRITLGSFDDKLEPGFEEGNGNQITLDKEKKDQQPKEQEGAEEKNEGIGGINRIEDELKYIDDEEDLDATETEREKKQADADDLPFIDSEDTEERKQMMSTSTFKSLPHHIDLNEIESLCEYSEKEDMHINRGVEICEETATSWKESSQKSESELGSTQAMENNRNLIEFIDIEENVSSESVKGDQKATNDDMNNMLENMECLEKDSEQNRDFENAEDNTSTESQVDDEMELYLTSLRNSQQPLAMPSISESMDEDQPNSSLEDLTNIEYNMELERATLPLVDGNEHVIGRNVLWWKEFLSYDN
ncbi:hypothetical protein M9458_049301, partial [Cirrhinus mrigala]